MKKSVGNFLLPAGFFLKIKTGACFDAPAGFSLQLCTLDEEERGKKKQRQQRERDEECSGKERFCLHFIFEGLQLLPRFIGLSRQNGCALISRAKLQSFRRYAGKGPEEMRSVVQNGANLPADIRAAGGHINGVY